MVVHIGGNRAVPLAQVVAIIDVSKDLSRDQKHLLKHSKEAGLLHVLGKPAKSLVLLQDGEVSSFCLSPLSTRTLAKRISRAGLLSLGRGFATTSNEVYA